MRLIGIDPGYGRLGVAVVERKRDGEHLLFSVCLTTAKTLAFPKRLLTLGQALEKIIKKYQPAGLALEDLFFAKNRKTAMAVAETRGMIIYLAAKHKLIITTHAPNTVKLAVTGHGHADKNQMMLMFPKLIQIEKTIKHDDEFGAIAVALTALVQQRQSYPQKA